MGVYLIIFRLTLHGLEQSQPTGPMTQSLCDALVWLLQVYGSGVWPTAAICVLGPLAVV
jgi:hypothetical protein